jgi:hypothetical protein
VFVLAAIVASPASAAFPGRNGLLAVQPVSGGGVLLVNAQGGAERRICTDRSRCGTPRTPRWSPDGRALVFTAPTIHLIYPDGSCLNCTMGAAGTPAFTANPALVTFDSGGKLLEDGIDGIRKATIVGGPFSAAVWSARGELAVARGGSVWAGSPHHLRRITTGSAPSWSPSGSQLAVARDGWVLVVGVRNRSVKRLVRGGAPAWSPDGKSIAFIGAGHHLLIVPASGGLARRVGNVRGVSVDWQPVPRTPPAACVAPPGSKVLASSSTAVVTSDSSSASTAAMGCLLGDGRERFLELLSSTPGETAQGVSAAGVGDGYAALANGFDDLHYGNLSDTVAVYDLGTGAIVPGMGGEVANCSQSCVSDDIDQVVVGPGGVSAAHVNYSIPPYSGSNPLTGISCPSASLCVAVDGVGHLFTSTDPTGGAWAETNMPGLVAVTCPSVSLCVGVTEVTQALGGAISSIYASTHPAGGSGEWYPVYTADGANNALTDISCASTSLCVAVDDSGSIITSTDPAGAPGQWTAANVDGTSELPAVSCPSVSLCVAADTNGHVVTSTNPTGGTSAWQAVNATASGTVGPQSVSCPSSNLCVGLGPNDDLFTSTNPTVGGSWSVTNTGLALDAIDCPSTSLCLAVGGEGALDASTDPASGAWTAYQIDNARDLSSISCASSTLCVAGDAVGDVVASANPTGGSAAWSATAIDGNPCSAGTSCIIEQIIASDSTGVHFLDSASEPAIAPPSLTALSLSGYRLTWDHDGSLESAELH